MSDRMRDHPTDDPPSDDRSRLDAMHASLTTALGRSPIAGEGALERVVVKRVDVPMGELALLWFKVLIAGIPAAGVVALVCWAVRGR